MFLQGSGKKEETETRREGVVGVGVGICPDISWVGVEGVFLGVRWC